MQSSNVRRKHFWQARDWTDWLFSILLLLGAAGVYANYQSLMDGYEVFFLASSVVGFSLLGWFWSPIRSLIAGVAALSLSAIALYAGDLSLMQQKFLLKFLISSQSAVMWMNVLLILATLIYWLALFRKSAFTGKLATFLTWSAVVMGLTGLMVRWYESYLIAPDIGHIPLSNLYEVFILFCLITSMMYLYYEARYQTRQLGGGAWPFLVGGVICLVNSDNERDRNLLTGELLFFYTGEVIWLMWVGKLTSHDLVMNP